MECVNVGHRTVHKDKTGAWSDEDILVFVAKGDLKVGTQLLTNYGKGYEFDPGCCC